MTQQPHPGAADARSAPAPDLEYDLAHEATDQRCMGQGSTSVRDLVQAPVHTDEYGGDYSYDLAHEIPRPTRP